LSGRTGGVNPVPPLTADELLALATSLSGLAHALFEATVADIEQIHRPVRLES
jgi:hypothetical protein